MSEADRIRWDARHAEARAAALAEPEPSLAWLPRPSAGARALDLASGRGRNSRALLALGYRVVAADISAVALNEVRRHCAGAEGLLPVQADLEAWPFAPECFDLILQCDYLDRRAFAPMKASTRRGGHVLIDTFGRSATDSGPRNPSYRLEPGELARVFADWDILQLCSDAVRGREAILARRPVR